MKSLRMPTTRDEDFRFTDISPLLKSSLQAARSDAELPADFVSSLVFPEAASSVVVLVNGQLRPTLSKLGGLPKGSYVGGLAGAPAELVDKHLGAQSRSRGGPFSVINGALAPDVLCVVLPPGATMTNPLLVLHIATGSSSKEVREVACPRLLVVAGEGALCEVVEEFVSAGPAGGSSLTCSVGEMVLAKDAMVTHRYVERESSGCVHMRVTLVQQQEASSYTLTEARLGGELSRHDLGIKQEGGDTVTEMRHFLLAGPSQTCDLHSRLELNHPQGTANQVHKCIVSAASGKGVFDGNVKVNRLAQRTDAQQLSRNLLLVPLATVNVKPNLQIIADDVKCTHGCAVSDLSEEELFYFRSRGINADLARQTLVASFGSEVTGKIPYKQLVQRIAADVQRTLIASGTITPALSS